MRIGIFAELTVTFLVPSKLVIQMLNSKVAGKTNMLLLLACIGALLSLPATDALVAVPLPGRNVNTGWSAPIDNAPTAISQEETTPSTATVIVRKTTKDDISQISSLLASASAGSHADALLNWNAKM